MIYTLMLFICSTPKLNMSTWSFTCLVLPNIVHTHHASVTSVIDSYLDREYFLPVVPWGSCCRMARMAVGAVNMEEAPCSDRTRKKAPGSGVPTGLPYEKTPCQIKDQKANLKEICIINYRWLI